MKSIHIISTETLNKHKFSLGNCHWIDIPGGHVVIHEKPHILEAESGTTSLPHLLDGSPVGQEVADKLAIFGVKESDSTFKVSTKIAAVHAAFLPTQF